MTGIDLLASMTGPYLLVIGIAICLLAFFGSLLNMRSAQLRNTMRSRDGAFTRHLMVMGVMAIGASSALLGLILSIYEVWFQWQTTIN